MMSVSSLCMVTYLHDALEQLLFLCQSTQLYLTQGIVFTLHQALQTHPIIN
jgi:hypothetical protein